IVVKDSKTEFRISEDLERSQRFQGVDLKIYDIDAIDRFESEISQSLPGDESKAKLAFEAYLSRTGREAFEREAIQAYQGIMTAVRYGLEKPARRQHHGRDHCAFSGQHNRQRGF